MGWKCFQKNGLGDGLKGSAAQTLENSEEYKALKIPRRAAHERAEGKEGDGENEITFSSKEPAQPSGNGDDNGIGYKIRGNRPGGFVNPCREASADMIKGDIDDRCVDDLDERREHDCDGNNPPVHTNPVSPSALTNKFLHRWQAFNLFGKSVRGNLKFEARNPKFDLK